MKINFRKILQIGTDVIGTLNPAVGAAISAVNELLPEDKKLPQSATVGQLQSAVDSLPPEQRQLILAKEIDLQIAEVESFTAIQQALAEADAKGSSTRPDIARLFAYSTVSVVVPIGWACAYAIIAGDTELMASINGFYLVPVALVAPFLAVIDRYFGKRTREKEMRQQAAYQQPIVSAPGLITNVIEAMRGK